MKFKGEVHNGKMELYKKCEFLGELRKLENKKIVLDIKDFKEIRSNDQNGLYWEFLTAVSKMTGYTIIELHDLFKVKFCLQIMGIPISEEQLHESFKTRAERQILGKLFSTTAFNTKQFAEYGKKVRDFVLDNGIIQLSQMEYDILETFFRD